MRNQHKQLRLEALAVFAMRKVFVKYKRDFLSAYKKKIKFDVESLSKHLKEAMYAITLLGYQQAIKDLGLQALALSESTEISDVLEKQLDIAGLDKIQSAIDSTALRVATNVTDSVERELRKTVNDLIVSGTGVDESVRILREKFNNLGLTVKNDYRLETIIRTQSQIAYNAGSWIAYQDPVIWSIIWGFEYHTVGDNRVRDSHELLELVTLPKDHPFWLKFFPPNGWSCRCQVVALFEKPSRIKNPPKGVEPDKGFDFNPGVVLGKDFKLPDIPSALDEKKKLENIVQQTTDKKVKAKAKQLLEQVKKKVTPEETLKDSGFDLRKIEDVPTSKSNKIKKALAKQVEDLKKHKQLKEFLDGEKPLRLNIKDLRKGESGNFYHSATEAVQMSLEKRLVVSLSDTRPTYGEWSVGNNLRSVFRHEIGHWYHFFKLTRIERSIWRKMYRLLNKKWDGYLRGNVGRYGATDEYELFAEAFSAYTNNRYVKGSLPEPIEDFLRDVLE